MQKGGRLGICLIVLVLVAAMCAAWWIYPRGAPPIVAQDVSAAVAAPASAPATMSSNAADLYRRAAEICQSIQSNEAQSQQLQKYEDGHFDSAAAAFFVQYQEILTQMRSAATVSNCDWGLTAMSARLPGLGGMRSISNFSLAHARWAGSQKQTDQAVADLVANLALARNVSKDGLLVSNLVEVAIESQAIDQLAFLLMQMSPDQLRQLSGRLDALPPFTTGKQMMDAEFAFAQDSIRSQNAGVIAVAMVDGLKDFYGKLGAVIDQQTPAEFTSTVNAEIAKIPLNTFAKIQGPSFARGREAMAALQAKRAMVRLAIDIRLNGESAVASSKDPFGNGPFVYAKSADGFQISSALTRNGSPVVLIVGTK